MGKNKLTKEKQEQLFQRWLNEYGDGLIEYCEFCGSTDIITIGNPSQDMTKDELSKQRKLYTANYKCNSCGATANVSEVWSK